MTRFRSGPLSLALLLLATSWLLVGCQDDEPDVPPRAASTTSADGVAIAYTVTGAGPDVVLVHCWCGNRTFYDAVLGDLARDHRVIALDLAGHGESGDTREDYTMQAFAADVLAVMDAEQVREAVLVGHSMGGTVAMALAQQAPTRVRGIVGIDNLHRVDAGHDRAQIDPLLAAMRDDFAGQVTAMVASMFPAGTDPDVIALAREPMIATGPAVGISAFAHLFDFDLASAARAYARPLDLVNDDGYPVDTAQWRAHGVDVRVTLLESVGHFPMFSAPDTLRLALREAVLTAGGGATDREIEG
jgi:pimeloyl-ACP methyl ester carboxylesterase